jgi:hypothetical protein
MTDLLVCMLLVPYLSMLVPLLVPYCEIVVANIKRRNPCERMKSITQRIYTSTWDSQFHREILTEMAVGMHLQCLYFYLGCHLTFTNIWGCWSLTLTHIWCILVWKAFWYEVSDIKRSPKCVSLNPKLKFPAILVISLKTLTKVYIKF